MKQNKITQVLFCMLIIYHPKYTLHDNVTCQPFSRYETKKNTPKKTKTNKNKKTNKLKTNKQTNKQTNKKQQKTNK